MTNVIIRTAHYNNINIAVEKEIFETSFKMNHFKVGDFMYVIPMANQSAIEGLALKAKVTSITYGDSQVNWDCRSYGDDKVFIYTLTEIEYISYEEAVAEANNYHPAGFRGMAYLTKSINDAVAFEKALTNMIKDTKKVTTYLVDVKKTVSGVITPKNANKAIKEFQTLINNEILTDKEMMKDVAVKILSKYSV